MELYEELQQNHDLFSSRNEDKDWFKLEKLPILSSIVLAKPLQATYVSVEILEPEPDVKVYDISLYADDGTHVGGAEIASNEIVWD